MSVCHFTCAAVAAANTKKKKLAVTRLVLIKDYFLEFFDIWNEMLRSFVLADFFLRISGRQTIIRSFLEIAVNGTENLKCRF